MILTKVRLCVFSGMATGWGTAPRGSDRGKAFTQAVDDRHRCRCPIDGGQRGRNCRTARSVNGQLKVPMGGHENCPWAANKNCPVADTNLPMKGCPPPVGGAAMGSRA